MTTVFFKYRFMKLMKSFHSEGGIAILILAGSVAWIGFILVNSSSLIQNNTSANFAPETNPAVVEKNTTVNMLAKQIADQQIESVFHAGTALIDQKKFALFVAQKQLHEISAAMAPLFQEPSFSIDQIIVEEFSSEDWYQGAMRTRMPYLSKTYYSTSIPKSNVFSFSFPIFDGNKIVAVIAVQMKPNLFLQWLADAKLKNEGYTFIVDQLGQVVAHPDIDPEGDIQDYSNQHDVKRSVDNQESTEVVFIGEDKYISSFRPLNLHGWGVITRVKTP